MHDNDEHTVSAADFVRHFAQYRDAAAHAPVYITRHGRKTHALLGMEQFEGFEARAQGSPADKSVDESLFALADWIDEALILCDGRMNVVYANRVAQAITRKPSDDLIGKPIFDALPAINGSLMEVHARRTMVGSEPSAADVPSPFQEDAWLRFQSFPLGLRNVLKFRDITEDVQRHRLADVKAAILDAMAAHGAIGYVRVSVRGTIDRVDKPFCDMLDLPDSRLAGLPLVDLVAIRERVAFRDAMESVLRGGDAVKRDCQFLTNKGDTITARVAIVQLHGAYGAEGAIILMTPRDMPA
ncbi:MAG: PAS domain-containing protein [Novosphingobium sp.]|nr:PAS domain-containing protein [Novosphingobium sp.]